MHYLIQLLVSGLAIGAIYGLIAMGFAVIYRSTGLVNFAQGEMTMIVAYKAWTISTTISGNVFVVAIGAILAAIVLGLVIERVVMRPMLGEPVFATVMVTIGLAVILRSSINFIWDAYPHGLDIGVGRSIIRIGSIGVRTGQIAVIATLLLLLAAICAFFRYSKFGIAMRAVAADDRTALLMGISATRVHSIAWAASSVIAGIAGVFVALTDDLSPAPRRDFSPRPQGGSGHHPRPPRCRAGFGPRRPPDRHHRKPRRRLPRLGHEGGRGLCDDHRGADDPPVRHLR